MYFLTRLWWKKSVNYKYEEGFVFDKGYGSWGILGSILGDQSKIKKADSALALVWF